LLASDGSAGDGFGTDVAISGNVILVGASLDDDQGVMSGSAYAFVKDGAGNWVEEAKLIPADSTANTLFGASIVFDGQTAVIGASHDDQLAIDSGAAYVFKRDSNGNWLEHAKLKASDASYSTLFGSAVSQSGAQVIIGSYWDNQQATRAGAAYVFAEDASGVWSEQAKLIASDATGDDIFGFDVSLSGDYAVIGAYGHDHFGNNAGAAYVFNRDSNGNWTEQVELSASDPDTFDLFGWSVSINGDLIAVGSPGDDDNVSGSGSVYLYERDLGGQWIQQTKLTAANFEAGAGMGKSVAVNGTTVFAGAPDADPLGSASGLVYAFELINVDSDGDGIVDAADNCPLISNSDQADNDFDGIGDVCDSDDDNDGVADTLDNCKFTVNADQADIDADGVGDACDDDIDGDTVINSVDNCVYSPNTDQTDTDGDLLGDACDVDDDNDRVLDSYPDNCPLIANEDQLDTDADNIGDACDSDIDNDGILNTSDNCPLVINVSQQDSDGDSAGDACDDDDDNDGVLDVADNCPVDANSDQADSDGNGIGDVCDVIVTLDSDNDGIEDTADNCPFDANTDQTDTDGDAMGDACDMDDDNDNIADSSDICPATTEGAPVDPETGCSIVQLCPCDNTRGSTQSWRNHGMYVSCVAKASKTFVQQGLIDHSTKDNIVSAAGQSSCGAKN
jgi:hypothetical protein